MTRRPSRMRYVVLLLLVSIGAWYWVTPRRAWDQFVRAIALGDSETLERIVDFPTVRTNLKSDLRSAIAERSQTGGIAPAVGALMLDPMVEMMVQPTGFAELVNSFAIRGTDATQKTVVSYRYRSLSRVDVHIRSSIDPESAAGVFTFERSMLHWRLVRVWSDRLAASRESR